MHKKNHFYLLGYLLILFGMLVSGYLLFHHYSVISGNGSSPDLCSLVFGKGCSAASMSGFSQFLRIPVGGWGLIYLCILGCLIIFSRLFFPESSDEAVQAAFWISFAGIFFSLFYVVIMILYPVLFCPFCTVFHITNFALFYTIKKLTRKSFKDLTGGLLKSLGIVFLAKPLPEGFVKLKWLVFVVPLILGLCIYQWSLIQGLNIRMDKLSAYDPLMELEEFDAKEQWNIQLTADDPLSGAENAPVTLVVFSDFQCTACEMFATNYSHLVNYNKGNLNIRLKYFPLSSECNPLAKTDLHPFACQAARAAEAARMQGRFWEYHDSLFARQPVKSEAQLLEIAQALKLDMEKFKADYHSTTVMDKINRDIKEGIRLKLEGTPTAFLNGKKLQKLSLNSVNFLTKYLAH